MALKPDQILMLCLTTGLIIQLTFTWLVYSDRIVLTPGGVSVSSLTTFNQRFEFCCRWWTLIALWLVLNVYAVIGCRSVAKKGKFLVDPLAGTTNGIDLTNAILRNSMEQALVYVLLQLSMLPKISPSIAIKLIPFVNVTWFVARVLFAIGYPRYRSVGNGMSITLLVPLTLYSIYLNAFE